MSDARRTRVHGAAANAPYSPRLVYLCDDWDCCPNGAPQIDCHICGQDWPCDDYRGAHTPAQIARQERWVQRVWDRGLGW